LGVPFVPPRRFSKKYELRSQKTKAKSTKKARRQKSRPASNFD
jgi:hypothetical protein